MGGWLTNTQWEPTPLLKLQIHNHSSLYELCSKDTQGLLICRTSTVNSSSSSAVSYASAVLVKRPPSVWTANNLGTILEMALPSPLYPALLLYHQAFYILLPKSPGIHPFLFHLFCHILDQAPFTSHLDCSSGLRTNLPPLLLLPLSSFSILPPNRLFQNPSSLPVLEGPACSSPFLTLSYITCSPTLLPQAFVPSHLIPCSLCPRTYCFSSLECWAFFSPV